MADKINQTTSVILADQYANDKNDINNRVKSASDQVIQLDYINDLDSKIVL